MKNSMKKLTLNQIAPYLPYKLNILLEISMEESDSFEMTLENIEGILEYQRKPLLRPLSQLTDIIEIDGKIFTPIEDLLMLKHPVDGRESKYCKIHYEQTPTRVSAWYQNLSLIEFKVNTFDLTNEPYWITQKLIEWHFDVFCLIEKGMAMDLNTVKNQTA